MPKKSLMLSGSMLLGLMALGVFLDYLDRPVFWPGYIGMAGFYAIMFFLGSFAGEKTAAKSGGVKSMILAGRSLPLGLALMTMTATWVGGGFISGTAESVAGSGLAWAQAPWGYALSLVVGGFLFAPIMRRHKFTTMLDPLQDRFGSKMGALLYLPALLGEVFWTAAILTALGTMFAVILGLSFEVSIIVSASIAIAYTALGGLRAVAYTDVLQLLILLVGLWLTLPFVLESTNGIAALWNDYRQSMGATAYIMPAWGAWRDPAWGDAYWLWWDYALLLVFGGIPWHVYFQRVLSSKSPEVARGLSIGAGVLCVIAALPAVIIGMVGHTTDWAAIGQPAPASVSLMLPHVLKYLTPEPIAVLSLAALAAAVMSSVDSSILSASSMGTWNIIRPLWAARGRTIDLEPVIRRMIWIVGIAATLIALKLQSIYALWFLCSDFVYTILFPQLVTALYDKKANTWGSLSGFIVALMLRLGGGEPVLGLPRWIDYPMIDAHGVVNFPFRTTAMLTSLITIIVVSRLTGRWMKPKALVKRKD
ncbi:MAG: sodium:solute symporter family protein [Phycisphaerae bacterium]|nr:sodium:solute symporter family protein [Phycisphaerae bacterium]